jgi:hypothetical protein
MGRRESTTGKACESSIHLNLLFALTNNAIRVEVRQIKWISRISGLRPTFFWLMMHAV